jgi:hypothetical protein
MKQDDRMLKSEGGMPKLNCKIYQGAENRAVKTEPETH